MRSSIFPSSPPALYLAGLFRMFTCVVLLQEGSGASFYRLIVVWDKEGSAAEQGGLRCALSVKRIRNDPKLMAALVGQLVADE